jgi:hypothetical protein
LLVGASDRHPVPSLGLTQLGPGDIVAVGGFLELDDPPSEPVHALATSPTTRPMLNRAAPGRRFRPGRARSCVL